MNFRYCFLKLYNFFYDLLCFNYEWEIWYISLLYFFYFFFYYFYYISYISYSFRYVRNSKLTPRSLYENPLLKYSKLSKRRRKRQSDPDAISLCPTETQYITPRAALNNQGNWMYVVNLEENQKYSQVVRSEKCT